MATYRKKPVEIEARQFNGQTWGATADALAEWCGGEYETDLQPSRPTLRIRTLEGVMEASPGDWIIRGVQGEFYPCKPDIFEQTYVAADQPEQQDDAHLGAVQRFFTASEHEDVVALRDRIVALGAEIERRVPAGRNKALALTALEDVQMRGNRGLFAPEGLR